MKKFEKKFEPRFLDPARVLVVDQYFKVTFPKMGNSQDLLKIPYR